MSDAIDTLQDDLPDMISDAITDSMDMDWSSRDGARAVIEALNREGLMIVRRATVEGLVEAGEKVMPYQPSPNGWCNGYKDFKALAAALANAKKETGL